MPIVTRLGLSAIPRSALGAFTAKPEITVVTLSVTGPLGISNFATLTTGTSNFTTAQIGFSEFTTPETGETDL